MQSKHGFGKGLSLVGFILFGLLSQVNAAPVNYMMGVVPVGNIKVSTSSPVINVATNTATTCMTLLNSFHKEGDKGDEVIKLQKFLNKYNGANLNEKGFYGPVTAQEVKNLQFTYGIKVTGVQHIKTTDLINKINCGKIANKDRLVYVITSQNTNTNIDNNISVTPKKIYPNAPETKLQKNLQAPKEKTIPTKVGSEQTSVTATTTGFVDNLKSDFNKIKENYKAYLLVFVLVLALFWFLRKAATE